MATVEFYEKLKIRDAKLAELKHHVDAIVDCARKMGEATLRCDWFIHEGKERIRRHGGLS